MHADHSFLMASLFFIVGRRKSKLHVNLRVAKAQKKWFFLRSWPKNANLFSLPFRTHSFVYTHQFRSTRKIDRFSGAIFVFFFFEMLFERVLSLSHLCGRVALVLLCRKGSMRATVYLLKRFFLNIQLTSAIYELSINSIWPNLRSA